MIWSFDELPEEQAAAAGGKGRVLARAGRWRSCRGPL